MKKIISLLIVLLVPFFLFAENFYLDGYDISIKVNEDGSAHIDETLNVVFTSPSHGIYRDIQYRFDNPVYEWAEIVADISNIKCNLPFEIEYSNGFESLKIGSKDSYMSSPSLIHIAYDYDLGGDIYQEYDEFYYNFISAAWDCPIYNINLEITFPKSIDPAKAFITYGDYGSDRRLNYKISNDNKTIRASLASINSYQAITIRAEMENGYFTKQAPDWFAINKITVPFSTLIFILFLLYAFLSYRRHGVDNPLTPPVVFTPPKDYNPMDVGFVYDGKLNSEKEISAMFFYWADKGYLKLKEENKEFTFIKVKDIPDSECEAEKKLFSLLFVSGDEVSFKDLERSNFYLSVPEKVFPLVKKQFTGKCALIDPKSKKIKGMNFGLMLLACVLSSIVISLSAIGDLTLMSLGTEILTSILLFSLSSKLLSKWNTIKKFRKTIQLIPIAFIALGAFLVLSGINLTLLKNEDMGFLYALVNVAAILISSFVISATDKRSEYGERKLEEILGFKDFIEKVEIDKLKLLIDEDPEIFYHTLSFAIVFGLEETWARKFASLYIPRCNWYYGPADAAYDAMFYSAMVRRSRNQYRMMQELNIANSAPKSGGGGSHSFSGSSGFSGGGFSGGGGRSW